RPEELAQLGDERVGILERGEVPATRGARVAAQIEPGLDELARRPDQLVEERDARRHGDARRLREARARAEGLVVHAQRRADRARRPVDREVRQELVARERAQEIALAALVGAVAPAPPLLEDPRREAGRRVGEREGRGLRLRALEVDIAPLAVAVALDLFPP